MDTDLARTFLAVIDSGSFVHAAERLHVSQSTVSTRIHALEDQLGCVLFVRNKAGAALTHAGRQFQRHASAIVRTIEQARHDIGVPDGFRGTLAVGGRIGLWEEYLLHWLAAMREQRPEISVRAESGLEADLMPGLIEGRLDVGVMYTPQSRPGLKIEKLFDERLVLVSTNPRSAPEPRQDYVYVDWGAEFYTKHKTFFPNFGGAALTVNIGWLGLQHLMGNGGAGYFPRRIVQPHLSGKRLTIVRNAPEFLIPAYVVYPAEHDLPALPDAVAIMHATAQSIMAEKPSNKATRPVHKKEPPGRRRVRPDGLRPR
jgi:DNA-binding transcriptional LysR family regulator